MTEFCPNCFGKVDFYHECNAKTIAKFASFETYTSEKKGISLENIVLIAPLMGLVLDFALPFPSSILHSILLSISGSALVAIFWVIFNYQGSKSFNFYIKNFKNFIYTPNMLKIYSTKNNEKFKNGWLAVIAISSVLQILIFTPGNAGFLEHQVTAHVKSVSGVTLKTACPRIFIYLYNSTIECRVKTGLLGISVPARTKLSPVLGTSDIKVSLL